MSILFDAHEDPTNSEQGKKSRARNQQEERYPAQQSMNKHDDILVFGYHCKLFRDDQTAEDVNNGKFLIPWMGNKDLMIDRYDCRGHLYRLEEFDFENMGEFLSLSPDRMDIENVCDEERYLDLRKDGKEMSEENILQEEEDKRGSALYDPFTAYQNTEYSYEDSSDGIQLSDVTASVVTASSSKFDYEMYTQFCQYYGYDPKDENLKAYFESQNQMQNSYQYDYERPPPPSEPPPPDTQDVVTEPVTISAPPVPTEPTYEKFKPPEGIEFPNGMEMPVTRKMQNIIDKTAMFISKQSAQMEIVLKTKQSGNPQFAFLEFDNYMNPYYKFILQKIKNGEYEYVDQKGSEIEENTSKDEVNKEKEEVNKEETETEEPKVENENENENDSDDDGEEHELHPLLQAHRRPLNNHQAVPSPSAVNPEADVDKPIINPIPQTKTTGKVEDLAKVYMQWKYMPNPSEISQHEVEEEKDVEENGESSLQEVDELPPPPLPPPPNFMLPKMEEELPPIQPELAQPPKPFELEHPALHLRQHPLEMEQPMNFGVPPPPHGGPIFGGSMLPPPLPPPPSLRPPHFPQMRPPHMPLPQGFHGMPGHFLNRPFQHINQQNQYPHPPELYQVRSAVPPPPPPPLPSLLPPGVDAPPAPLTFITSCTDSGTIYDTVGPPPLIPLSNHAPATKSLLPSPIDTNPELSPPETAEGLLPPGVETEEKLVVPPPPPPPLPPSIGLFNMDPFKNNDSIDGPSGGDGNTHNEVGNDFSNNNKNRTLHQLPQNEGESPIDSPQYTDSENERTFHRESKRRKRNHNKCDSPNTETNNQTSPSDLDPSDPDPSSNSPSAHPTKIITPNTDLQLVVDRLALYVVKNGEEFEVGIKEKKDPRFDFLNPWNIYHPYYLSKKRAAVEAEQDKKRKEEERRKNLKVKFDLKTKIKPVSVAATKKKASTTASVFNQNEEDEAADNAPAEGFQPNADPEVEVKRKLQKQIEEKEKLLKQLHEQALLQQKIAQVNRQAGAKPMIQNLSPQQQALLKKKVQEKQATKDSTKDNALSAKQDERKKRAATFVGKLKKSAEAEESNDTAGNFLRKRQFKESSSSTSTQEATDRAAYEKKKDAFFQAINDAFKGGTT